MINRFSSRRQRLDHHFLNERLHGALGYDRIAGFFSSSILEVAGEALESMQGKVRMVCNAQPELLTGDAAKERFRRLHDFLRTGKLLVRVLPDPRQGRSHYPSRWAK